MSETSTSRARDRDFWACSNVAVIGLIAVFIGKLSDAIILVVPALCFRTAVLGVPKICSSPKLEKVAPW